MSTGRKHDTMDPTQIELDQVLALLDKSVQQAYDAMAAVQEHAQRARALSRVIREQSGRIRQTSDQFRLRFDSAMKQEIARVSERPLAV